MMIFKFTLVQMIDITVLILGFGASYIATNHFYSNFVPTEEFARIKFGIVYQTSKRVCSYLDNLSLDHNPSCLDAPLHETFSSIIRTNYQGAVLSDSAKFQFLHGFACLLRQQHGSVPHYDLIIRDIPSSVHLP